MNEPARASEPLGGHWGNFTESHVLKQTWLRDGTVTGTEFDFLSLYEELVWRTSGSSLRVTHAYLQRLAHWKKD